MSKYIIEIPDDVQYVLLNGKADDKYYTAVHPIAELEELNSDYINEHYGSLQDEAYKQGYVEAERIWRAPSSDNEFYQKGLGDAWEAARKIIHMPEGDLLNIFTECYSAVCTALQVLLKYDASEAIAKLKAYEDKQKDRIEVGDEVVFETEGAEPFVILHKYYDDAGHPSGYRYFVYAQNGEVLIFNEGDGPKKTGRHFQETNKLLEAIRA